MTEFLGCGTKLYGHVERRRQDNSYITTKWVIVFMLPLIPLKSYRVTKDRVTKTGHNEYVTHYSIVETLPLNMFQVLSTYIACIFFPIIYIIVFGRLVNHLDDNNPILQNTLYPVAFFTSPIFSFLYASKINRNRFGWGIAGLCFPLIPAILTIFVESDAK